jgi:threonine dehydrogenase-like Zn-dependent dehydrogenase
MFGYSHFTGGFAGGQAEYTRVPHGDANLPAEVADEDGLYLSDILSTSYNQVMDTNVKEGDIVAIWGAGAIGLSSAKWCFLKKAARVILIDNVQWRLDYAKEKLPGIETLNFNEVKDIPGKLNEMTAPGTVPGPHSDTRPAGVDIALECAAGEYAKGWGHAIELAVGLETDTSEILNEMIRTSDVDLFGHSDPCAVAVRPWGSIGITGTGSFLSEMWLTFLATCRCL